MTTFTVKKELTSHGTSRIAAQTTPLIQHRTL